MSEIPGTNWYEGGITTSRLSASLGEMHADECFLASPQVHPELGLTCIRGDHPTPTSDCMRGQWEPTA